PQERLCADHSDAIDAGCRPLLPRLGRQCAALAGIHGVASGYRSPSAAHSQRTVCVYQEAIAHADTAL
ncbi:hypothetical protein LPJ57_007360, partial [Coemansia sp. RSA 486]